jgi:hypothetical protein
VQSKERILKAVKKWQVTKKGNPIRTAADFSTEPLIEGGHGMVYFEHLKKITANLDYSTQQTYHS